jgi:hypothetical protein
MHGTASGTADSGDNGLRISKLVRHSINRVLGGVPPEVVCRESTKCAHVGRKRRLFRFQLADFGSE